MLTALWPLFLMDATAAVDTPEVVVVQDVVELFVVSADIGIAAVREI